nr:hypothetical protein [Trichoderma asperellum]
MMVPEVDSLSLFLSIFLVHNYITFDALQTLSTFLSSISPLKYLTIEYRDNLVDRAL